MSNDSSPKQTCMFCANHRLGIGVISCPHERRDEVTHLGQLGTRCPERKWEAGAWSVKPPKARMGLSWIQPEPDLSVSPGVTRFWGKYEVKASQTRGRLIWATHPSLESVNAQEMRG